MTLQASYLTALSIFQPNESGVRPVWPALHEYVACRWHGRETPLSLDADKSKLSHQNSFASSEMQPSFAKQKNQTRHGSRIKMTIELYCANCTFHLDATDEQTGSVGYCPHCRTRNKIPHPDHQRLDGQADIVLRATFTRWYFGPEPSHQKHAFVNAIDHLAHVTELLERRETFEQEADQKLRSSIKSPEILAPEDLKPENFDLLQNACTCVRLSQSGSAGVAKLRDHVKTIHGLLERRKMAGRFSSRVFRRDFAEVELEIISRELTKVCTCDDTVSLLGDFRAELEQLNPPSEFPELVDDYSVHFSDYVAVITAKSPALEMPENQPQLSHGGLPEEIASAVEAVQLSVENLRVTLRGYQEFGIKYLVRQQRTILGDEMGLGKTIEALGAMVHLNATESASRFLVVAPASVIYNWKREIEKRTDLPCHMLHKDERYNNAEAWNKEGGIGVTSFSTLWSLDLDLTQTIDLLIVDEAHKVKRQSADRSQLTERLARCSRRACLMTGTPLENHVSEFINLIRMCDNELATKLQSNPAMQHDCRPDAPSFRDEIAAVYLRRNQVDVLPELPESIETEEWVDLNDSDRKHYDEVKQQWNIQSRRQAANGTTSSSSKFRRLDELIEGYREQGKKVIVFSNFIKTLDLAAEMVGQHFSIRGNVPADKRDIIAERFNKATGFQVLIGQIEAAGVGINLQGASVVIIMEPQFKPTTEWQAIARAKRMGQKDRVMVHRILAANTVDENLSELLRGKSQSFDDYARECSVTGFSELATDFSDVDLSHQLLKMEA